MSKYFFQIAALLFFVNIGCGNAADKNDVVWQIGLFDKNYAEFAITDNLGRYNELFPNDVSFRPAVDDCGKSWPYIHPGNSDAWAGSRIHPFTINFDLESAPAGKFTLRIAFVSAHSSMPPDAVCVAIGQRSNEKDTEQKTNDTAEINDFETEEILNVSCRDLNTKKDLDKEVEKLQNFYNFFNHFA